jgi:hypothetical protein
MRTLTLEYLRGVCDALYYAQSELLGGEIEEEKDFDISAHLSGNDFEVRLTSCIAMKDSHYENDLLKPLTTTQVLYINRDTKPAKVIKDAIAAMESIYNLPLPEVV